MCNLIICYYIYYVYSTKVTSKIENNSVEDSRKKLFTESFANKTEIPSSTIKKSESIVEPLILDFNKLKNNGTFYRILLVTESEKIKNDINNNFCDTKFDELSKDIKTSFKIHFYCIKLKVIKNTFLLTVKEISYYNEIIKRMMSFFDDTCKLSNFNYELRNATKMILKEFDLKKKIIKQKFYHDHLKDILNENIKSINQMDQKKEIKNLDHLKETAKFNKSDSNQITRNGNEINLLKNCSTVNNVLSYCEKNFNSLKDNNYYFSQGEMPKNDAVFENDYKKNQYPEYVELFIIMSNAQIKIYYILQQYKNYFFSYIEESHIKEMHELKNSILKNKLKDINIKKQQIRNAFEFFNDSKNIIKFKIDRIFNYARKDFTRYLLN